MGALHRRLAHCALTVGAFVLAGAGGLDAQERSDGDIPAASNDSGQVNSAEPQPVPPVAKDKHGNEWVVAPIPTLTPSQGWGINLIAQYIFKPAGQSAGVPPSILGAGGFYTENKSWGALGAYLGHWRDDLWRVGAAGGTLDVHYDFYGIGNELADHDLFIPIEQKVNFGAIQALRRIVPNLYGGIRAGAAQTEVIVAGIDQPPVVIPPFQRETQSNMLGPLLQWDTRDDQFFPTKGSVAKATAMFVGGDESYEYYSASWNSYYAIDEARILAWRASLQFVTGDAPFYALPTLGRNSDLRGYKSGKYRDRHLAATQVEYRRRFGTRWGGVLFAGVGEVFPSFDELNTDDLLGSVGLGIRFCLTKKNKVNFRFDWAYGKDGSATYVSVGEAF